MGDLLALLQLIQTLTNQVGAAAALARRMREEGRDDLTAEEWATLQANDDTARGALADAIARAKAAGR